MKGFGSCTDFIAFSIYMRFYQIQVHRRDAKNAEGIFLLAALSRERSG